MNSLMWCNDLGEISPQTKQPLPKAGTVNPLIINLMQI